MLYILECMFRAIIATVGGVSDPLRTTGEKVTAKDAVVGLFGWSVVVLVIVGIRFFRKYRDEQISRRYREKHKDEEAAQAEYEQNDNIEA